MLSRKILWLGLMWIAMILPSAQPEGKLMKSQDESKILARFRASFQDSSKPLTAGVSGSIPGPAVSYHRAPVFRDWGKMEQNVIAWPTSNSRTLKCLADGAKPMKYHWLKDGKEIQKRRLDPYMNTSLSYLKLKELVPNDNGRYTCVVSNAYGSINHTYTLHVFELPRGRPEILRHFTENIRVNLGDNATLTCVVAVRGTIPNLTWLKWGKFPKNFPILTGQDIKSIKYIDPKYFETISSGDRYVVKVTIVNVTEEDLGYYTCRVSNDIGFDYVTALLSKKVEVETNP